MINRVHRCDHREQHLRRANVRGRFLAPDVLLARLQREAVGWAPAGIDTDADQPAGQRTLVSRFAGDERRMRTAVAHRYSEALRRSNRNIGAEFAGRRQLASARRSVATTATALAAWSDATMPVNGLIRPLEPGY